MIGSAGWRRVDQASLYCFLTVIATAAHHFGPLFLFFRLLGLLLLFILGLLSLKLDLHAYDIVFAEVDLLCVF